MALLALVVVAVIVVVVVAASLVGSQGGGSADPLTPTSATAFDPLGDGREFDALTRHGQPIP